MKALIEAAARGDEVVVKALIEAGADINKAVPLCWAAENGHLGVVKALIEAGADINKADTDNRTPLYRAAARGHEAVVKALIEEGADVDEDTLKLIRLTRIRRRAKWLCGLGISLFLWYPLWSDYNF